MQMRRRFAIPSLFTALLTAILLVAGCSSDSETSDAPLPDAATLLQESASTTKAQQSVHLVLSLQGTIEGLPLEKLDGDLTNTPEVAAQGTADLVYMGGKFADVKFAVSEGNLYAAITPGEPLSLFGPAADVYDVSTILNPDNGLANLLANFNDATADGREAINGTETVRVTGTVSAEAVKKIAPKLSIDTPVPATAWIAEEGDHALLQAKLEPSAGNSITMTMSDWGKQVTVTKPGA